MNNTKYKKLEETILKEADLLIEKAKSQGEKALYNLFKSAILQKYKEQYDVEIQQGEVEKDAVDKSIDFLFENACVSFQDSSQYKGFRQRRCDKASTNLSWFLEANGDADFNR